MLTLAINTASSRSAIALLEKTPPVTILAQSSWPAQNREAELLMPEISKLLKKSGKNFQDIQQILVIKGPGSFTGLRIGITVANTIAYLNNCPLFAITTFDYWHSAASKITSKLASKITSKLASKITSKITSKTPSKPANQTASNQPLPVLLYAGRGGVYLSLNSDRKPELINLPDLPRILRKKNIKKLCGDISPEQKNFIKTNCKSVKFHRTKQNFAQTMKKILATKNLKPVKIVEPLYIKEPGISQPKKHSPLT